MPNASVTVRPWRLFARLVSVLVGADDSLYKYLGEDPPDETVVRLIVRMTRQKVLEFAP